MDLYVLLLCILIDILDAKRALEQVEATTATAAVRNVPKAIS